MCANGVETHPGKFPEDAILLQLLTRLQAQIAVGPADLVAIFKEVAAFAGARGTENGKLAARLSGRFAELVEHRIATGPIENAPEAPSPEAPSPEAPQPEPPK